MRVVSETRTSAEEPAHDVLAADMFAMPAADPELHHGPVRPPEDPAGIPEPHDVLAAEEFPMPAGRPRPGSSLMRPHESSAGRLLLVGMAVVIAALLLRRR
jgi:hypothetical protein